MLNNKKRKTIQFKAPLIVRDKEGDEGEEEDEEEEKEEEGAE